MRPLTEAVVRAARTGSVLSRWEAARATIADDHRTLLDLLRQGSYVYGVNAGVGHRHQDLVAPGRERMQQDAILASHRLPGTHWANAHQSRLVTATKLQQLSEGGSGVSPMTYEAVLACTADQGFRPRLPLDASYSSGDVIPGAWWAQAVVERVPAEEVGPKDILSLCNGSYVHVGCAIDLLVRTEGLRSVLDEVARRVREVGGAAPVDAGGSARSASGRGRSVEGIWQRGQDPVSIRATPQVMATLLAASEMLAEAIEGALGSPSDNPLITPEGPIEQASFLAPQVALTTSSLIEALLFTATWIERAVHWLCGGGSGVLPADLADEGSLGLIQVPKLATAWTEELRLRAGRRTWASGSATSHGIEDLWTLGLAATLVGSDVIDRVGDLVALLLTVLDEVTAIAGSDGDNPWHLSSGDLIERFDEQDRKSVV